MATNEPQTVEEIEAEILAILEDCQRRGLSKDEIREIFSPLGLPEPKSTPRQNRNKQGQEDKGQQRRRNRQHSGGEDEESGGGTWKRTVLYIAMVVVVGAFAVQFYEDELKGIRFHALAIIRITLIKVILKYILQKAI